MKQCLINNKVCSENNKKCKICELDNCGSVAQMIEDEEKYINIGYMNKLKNKLPEQCRNCSFLVVINLRQEKVYCPYRIKDKCMLKEKEIKSNGRGR